MPWDIVYYRQADDRVPVDEFLAGCPVKVRARLLAVLDDVAIPMLASRTLTPMSARP